MRSLCCLWIPLISSPYEVTLLSVNPPYFLALWGHLIVCVCCPAINIMKPFVFLAGSYCFKYIWPVLERHNVWTRFVDLYLFFGGWGKGNGLCGSLFSGHSRHFHNRVTAMYASKSCKQHSMSYPLINRYESADCSVMYVPVFLMFTTALHIKTSHVSGPLMYGLTMSYIRNILHTNLAVTWFIDMESRLMLSLAVGLWVVEAPIFYRHSAHRWRWSIFPILLSRGTYTTNLPSSKEFCLMGCKAV
jgi:hypothetical protein